ncbi:MAG: hypothetical protein M5U26_29905 [Planctomycetota bacterium]|nr:hypothetical protein [Planctomycetota bacterium]
MADLIYLCEICGSVLDEHHCKAVCPNCGRMFDCSDLPALQANGEIVIRNGQRVFIPARAEAAPAPSDSSAKSGKDS